MRAALGRIAVVIVCCAVVARAEAVQPDRQLALAQKELDEVKRFEKAGKYAEALPLAEHALPILEKALGSIHPEVAECLYWLGKLHHQQGSYDRAGLLYQRALQIREAVLGKDHPDIAQSLINLAVLYSDQGAYERAESLYRRVLELREAALGKNHPDVAKSLIGLANVYYTQGLYERAEPLYRRALQIHETAPEKNPTDLALSLNNFAVLYYTQGAYEQAEPLYRRALEIWEAALGKEHPAVAQCLNNLAVLYREQGAYARAELLYQRALQIQEATLGKNHPHVADSMNNLAVLYQAQGDYERAESLYQRTLQIYETALGKNHPDVALALNNFAELYLMQGAYERAEPLYQHALQIYEATQGKEHPDTAGVLANLGRLYSLQGAYERAEPLCQRALQSREATLGKNHPYVADSLMGLALLKVFQKHLGSAMPLFERIFAISEQRLRKEALSFSEARLASFLSLLRDQDGTLYNVLREHSSDAAARRLALTAALLHKGRSIGEIADASRTIYRNLGEAEREAFRRLRILRTQLATLSLSGPEQLSPADYQARLKELELQGDTLEAELAERSATFRAQQQRPPVTEVIARVAAALPTDGALIEIVAFTASPLTPPPGTKPSSVPKTPTYFALILLPSGDIRIANLGPAAAIDSAAARLHSALANRHVAYLGAAQELYRLVFQPMAPLLGSQRQLFLAPDGQLSLVPFAVLHDGTRFLADAYDLTYLTSGTDLLRRSADIAPANSVVAIVDPAFDAVPGPSSMTSSTSPEPMPSEPAQRSYALERFFSRTRGWLDQSWMPLPGTRKEAEVLRKLLPQTQVLAGPAATKKALLELPTPGLLHIGTHGGFEQDPTPPPSPRVRSASVIDMADDRSQHVPSDPLLRSVLVLAGIHAPAAPGDATTSRIETSLVTALEVAGLNLWGTQLVVLSACETGRGDARFGQGVYGLRRAFTVAGAETLVTSLWKVDDTTTHPLMESYYQRLIQGQGRAHAMHEAMKAVRAEHPHPYYWAPFIVIGNGAPLRGLGPSAPSAVHPDR